MPNCFVLLDVPAQRTQCTHKSLGTNKRKTYNSRTELYNIYCLDLVWERWCNGESMQRSITHTHKPAIITFLHDTDQVSFLQLQLIFILRHVIVQSLKSTAQHNTTHHYTHGKGGGRKLQHKSHHWPNVKPCLVFQFSWKRNKVDWLTLKTLHTILSVWRSWFYNVTLHTWQLIKSWHTPQLHEIMLNRYVHKTKLKTNSVMSLVILFKICYKEFQ